MTNQRGYIMKKIRIKYTLAFVLIIAALFANTTYAYEATGRQLAQNAIASLQLVATTSTTKNVAWLNWSWFEVNFYDEQYPLTVDVLGSNFASAKKVIYLLPGGGGNFSASFFTPMDNNLAQFFRQAGFLVIGITPREDNAPPGIYMADWGMAKHKADIQEIIGIIQAKIKLPYWVLGHSFGAAYALDYSSTCNDDLFKKVIALDIYSFDPTKVPDMVTDAEITYEAFLELINEGQFADSTFSDFKSLMFISLLFPKSDSGELRPIGGDFTYEGLLYFSMIDSYLLPGIHTPLTGLANDWPLVQSYVAGKYTFAANPLADTYRLTHSDIGTLRTAIFKLGSGLTPCAVYRDYFAVNAYNGAYTINWSGIRVPVLWVNSRLGYSGNTYGATLIKNSGNTNVKVPPSIPGYGHLDVLFSNTAQGNVWHLFLE
jgi:pimeloyl-ACP methyl ester carboxylesterase